MKSKIWTTARGSKVWLEGHTLRIQAHGGDGSYLLKERGFIGCSLEKIPEGTFFVSSSFFRGKKIKHRSIYGN